MKICKVDAKTPGNRLTRLGLIKGCGRLKED